MPGLLDLIAARNPEQAGGLLSDLVAPVRNRLSELMPAGLLDAARQYVRDAAPGGALNREWTPENIRTAGEVASMMPNPAGDVISGLLAVDDLRKGDYGSAALNSLGLVPFVPAMGGMTKNWRTGMVYATKAEKELALNEANAALNAAKAKSDINLEVAKKWKDISSRHGLGLENMKWPDFPDPFWHTQNVIGYPPATPEEAIQRAAAAEFEAWRKSRFTD